MKKLFCSVILFLFFCTPAWAEDSQEWILFKALAMCGDDYPCFDKQIDYFNYKGVVPTVKRAVKGDNVIGSNIKRLRKGRKHKRNVYYMTYYESLNDNDSPPECYLSLYYQPKTRKVEYITRGGECARTPLPAMPNGVSFGD